MGRTSVFSRGGWASVEAQKEHQRQARSSSLPPRASVSFRRPPTGSKNSTSSSSSKRPTSPTKNPFAFVEGNKLMEDHDQGDSTISHKSRSFSRDRAKTE